MKTILSLITIAIALSSCSKLDDITPDMTQPLYDKQEVHVYYDSAIYNINAKCFGKSVLNTYICLTHIYIWFS